MYRFFAVAAVSLALSSGAYAQTVPLTRVRFADSSGTIGVAQGWRLTASANGAASLTGPNGATMNLGIPLNVVVTGVENQFPDVPGVFPGVPRVSFSSPIQALADLLKALGPIQGLKISRFQAVEPTPWYRGGAAYIRTSLTLRGKPFENFGLYAIMPVNSAQALFYFSNISAPSADYRRQYPLMMAMWNSWSVNPALIKARLAGAAKALAEVDFPGTVNSVVANRRAAAEHAALQWNLYIRQ